MNLINNYKETPSTQLIKLNTHELYVAFTFKFLYKEIAHELPPHEAVIKIILIWDKSLTSSSSHHLGV